MCPDPAPPRASDNTLCQIQGGSDFQSRRGPGEGGKTSGEMANHREGRSTPPRSRGGGGWDPLESEKVGPEKGG